LSDHPKLRRLMWVLLLLAGSAAAWAAQPAASQEPLSASAPNGSSIRDAVVSLPIAAVLGAALAFRPRRRGTPPRDPAVIQTQIILALVGALVMLVVGASLARAFGIVGAASLVRYRSKIEDPKDAGVMLSCLAIGLASGVGIYWIAAVATLFILGVVWLLESQEPESHKDFLLKVTAKDAVGLRDALESVLRKNHVSHELRTSSQEDLVYSVRLPLTKKTDRLTSAILALGDEDEMAVEWSDRKPAKEAA
jgi:uncharacterized membrane protein YhiD involved in acid resistance